MSGATESSRTVRHEPHARPPGRKEGHEVQAIPPMYPRFLQHAKRTPERTGAGKETGRSGRGTDVGAWNRERRRGGGWPFAGSSSTPSRCQARGIPFPVPWRGLGNGIIDGIFSLTCRSARRAGRCRPPCGVPGAGPCQERRPRSRRAACRRSRRRSGRGTGGSRSNRRCWTRPSCRSTG